MRYSSRPNMSKQAAALARYFRFSGAVVGHITTAVAASPPVVAALAGVTLTSPYSNCSTVSAIPVLSLVTSASSRNPFELASASVLPSHERYLTLLPLNANARTVDPNPPPDSAVSSAYKRVK